MLECYFWIYHVDLCYGSPWQLSVCGRFHPANSCVGIGIWCLWRQFAASRHALVTPGQRWSASRSPAPSPPAPARAAPAAAGRSACGGRQLCCQCRAAACAASPSWKLGFPPPVVEETARYSLGEENFPFFQPGNLLIRTRTEVHSFLGIIEW